MVVEVAGWAILGVSALLRWSGQSWRAFLIIFAGWCAAYVGAFYVWLPAFPHWTWAHTIAVTTTLLLASLACGQRGALSWVRRGRTNGPPAAADSVAE